MTQSLFSLLGSYKPLEGISPEENYSTELFVYLLNYSLKNQTCLLKTFMEHLGEKINIPSYAEFSILSRQFFYTKSNHKAFPDIVIEDKDRFYFIEVKVESDLNYYIFDNKMNLREMINQIRYYQDIEAPKKKSIYLLTKYYCESSFEDCPDFKRKIRWYHIHQLLKEYLTHASDKVEKFLLNEAVKYLEEKNMSIPKVSYELMNGMESLKNLIKQLDMALEGIPKTNSFGHEFLGYNLQDGNKKSVGGIGTSFDGTKLIFQYYEQTLKAIKEQISDELVLAPSKKFYYVYFDFEKEHYFCLTAEQQIDKLKEWVNYNYKRLLEYSRKE